MNARIVKRWIVLPAVAALGIWVAVATLQQRPTRRLSAAWQFAVKPGELSSSHAFLANNCTACHTPTKGVEASNCIVCHANNQSLFQRQPTVFHADVQSCVQCHVEHLGANLRPTQMDHAALAKLGLRQMSANSATRTSNAAARERIVAWIGEQKGAAALPSGHPTIAPEEAALSCITCHSNQDRHREFFGTDCASCHGTAKWTIPEFRHPSSASQSCAQCHQAPPSHYMGHFNMISMKIAGQPHAQVSQCFLCHQTTAWNDIKGVGWYKHH